MEKEREEKTTSTKTAVTKGQKWALYLLMSKQDTDGSYSYFRGVVDANRATMGYDAAFRTAVDTVFPSIDISSITNITGYSGVALAGAMGIYQGPPPCPTQTQEQAIFDQLAPLP
jgi:hypothetical protein